MTFRLVERRTILCPTPLGWCFLIMLATAPILLWWFEGESFFSLDERPPAEILAVEGWIGDDGIAAAKDEFLKGGYKYIVTTSGLTGERWDRRRWNYAKEAQERLLALGLAADRIIVASPQDTEANRTYQSAVATRDALKAHGLAPRGVNVFTRGPHARRSRLIFAKVFGREAKVGVIAWVPAYYRGEPWWRSSERSEDLIKETVGWTFEVLLNSGRTS